jgi:hypothetical protein
MLRYRIAPTPTGRYIVLAASTSYVPISQTYGTRAEARDTADWLNRLRDSDGQDVFHQARGG